MPKFRYTAIDLSGKRSSGVVEAANTAAVADRLQRQSHLLLRADEIGRAGWLQELLHADLTIQRGVNRTVIAQFTRELSVMLRAGQDIDRALRFLVETAENKRFRQLLQVLRDQVRGGKSLASALAEHPAAFSRLYVSLVRAGEAGGKLAEALSYLADLLERERRLAATVQSALTYPAFLGVASLGTIILLLTYVLPNFTPIFAQAGAELPTATRILIGVGEGVRDYGLWMLIALLCSGFAARQALLQPDVRIAAERVLLRVPVAGLLVRRIQAARLSRTLGTLLRSGVTLVSALSVSRDVLSHVLARRLVDDAVGRVKSGERVATALAARRFFPPQTIHLLQIGEETGQLAEMALRAAEIHDEQVQVSVQRLVSLLVPLVTILMGLIVAGIVGSLLVAMLSLNDLAL
jgi:general secretion pathway protein F